MWMHVLYIPVSHLILIHFSLGLSWGQVPLTGFGWIKSQAEKSWSIIEAWGWGERCLFTPRHGAPHTCICQAHRRRQAPPIHGISGTLSPLCNWMGLNRSVSPYYKWWESRLILLTRPLVSASLFLSLKAQRVLIYNPHQDDCRCPL